MSTSTWIGLLVGFGAIFFGNLLEGGHVDSLIQGTAFFSVIGGTVGAVLVSNPSRDIKMAIAMFFSAFKEDSDDVAHENIKSIEDECKVAKKEGLVELEKQIKGLKDPFLKRALRNVVDGIDNKQTRETRETELNSEEEHLIAA